MSNEHPPHAHRCRHGAGLALIATLPLSAEAATPAQQANAWASYIDAPEWAPATDNLQWYVASQTITKQMVGKTLTMKATTPGAIDCTLMGVGYAGATGWVNVDVAAASTCAGNTTVQKVKVTRAMIGHELFLNGLSAVGDVRTSAVTGLSKVGGTSHTVRVEAEKAEPPVVVEPVATQQLIGTHNGVNVYIASAGGVNQIVVGQGESAKTYSTLQGEVWHVGMVGGRVDVWTKEGEAPSMTLKAWHLDVASGVETTQTMGATYVSTASDAPGFTIGDPTLPGLSSLVSWGGVKQFTGDPHYRFHGWTQGHALMYGSGGLTPSRYVFFVNMETGEVRDIDVKYYSGQRIMDATGATMKEPRGDGLTCRVQPDWTEAKCA